MKFELKQQFRIESARFLPNLADDHPCKSTHGHSFVITLKLVGEKNPKLGWVRDYNEITEVMTPLLRKLDHKVLNEVPGLENPSSENLAEWLFTAVKKHLPELVQVSVAETPTTECSYPAL